MRVSLNWLKTYLDLKNLSNDDLYQAIGLHISEIETMNKVSTATNLMIGYVKEKTPHPDSDHLNICQVELKDGISQIVCGAPNVEVGQKVIVALPGAILPGDFKIKPAKVRGVESNGMICSLQELGFAESLVEEKYRHGIYVLPKDAPVGEDAVKYLELDDTIIDLELTSNRSDLLSMEGVSYDLGAYLGQKPKIITPIVKEVRMVNPLKVRIDTPDCYEFQARYIKGITIAESPLWLKLRLMASGIRPINNVVDITNYVLIALGQPLHAYDHKFMGDNIIIRNALEGEKFTTLDGIERNLQVTDIVVANDTKAMCLGGVMGGLESEVTPSTKDIVLEAAMFSPLAIRKTSGRLGLKSESSIRFERKIDQLRISRALDYAAMLISELAGGVVVGSSVKAVSKPYESKFVDISTDKINGVLGTSLSEEEVTNIFNNLAYSFEFSNQIYHIEIPSRRMDLEASTQDIIEDVARMIGYDKIPTTVANVSSAGGLTLKQKKIRRIRQVLSSLGLNETVTYSLVSEADLNLYNIEELKAVKVLMPLTSDRAVMRQSVLNGIVEAISYNKARQMYNASFFEIGKRYGLENEDLMLAGGFTGTFISNLWQGINQKVDFFLVKGIIEELARRLDLEFDFIPFEDIKDTYHPGRAAKILIGDKTVGFLAELHPEFAKKHDLNETYVFELNLDVILDENNSFKYESIAKFPSIERDLAVVVKDNISAKEVIDVVKMTAKKLLTDIKVFDLYKGEGIGQDEKSIAFKMTFVDKNKTLDSSDVDKVIHSILNRLDYYFKARLR